ADRHSPPTRAAPPRIPTSRNPTKTTSHCILRASWDQPLPASRRIVRSAFPRSYRSRLSPPRGRPASADRFCPGSGPRSITELPAHFVLNLSGLIGRVDLWISSSSRTLLGLRRKHVGQPPANPHSPSPRIREPIPRRSDQQPGPIRQSSGSV